MKEKLTLTGKGYFELRTKDGKVLKKWEVSNTVVNDGKERVARRLFGNTLDPFSHIAIGTGTTSPTVNDTELETEVKRVSATTSYEASNKAVFEKTITFASGEAYDITEAGLFDSATASGSTMFDRFTFSAVSVDSDIDLYVKITITVN